MGDEAPGWERMCIRRRGGATTKERHTGRSDDYDDYYAPPPPVSEAAATSSDSELETPFRFGGQWDVVTLVRYTDLAFSVFSWGYLLVFLVSSSFSSSTGAGADKDMSSLGVAQYSLGTYGGGGGGKVEGGVVKPQK